MKENMHIKKLLKTTIFSSIFLVTILLTFLIYSFFLYEKYNTPIKIKDYTYQLQMPTYEETKKELDILPSNFEKVIKENNINLQKEEIISLLNNGYISIERGRITEISPDTPLLLTAENIKEYILKNLSIEDENLRKKIDLERTKILLDLKYKTLFLLPFLNSKERDIALSIYNGDISLEQIQNEEVFKKLLNLSEDKEKYISLTQLKDLLMNNGEKQIQNQNASNSIHLEENYEYYNNLLEYIKERRDILKDFGIYTNEYEDLISDMQKIVNKDSSIYHKIFPQDGEYILIKEIDGILTLSTSKISKENIPLNNSNFNNEYDVIRTNQSNGTVRIPVIMYHQIENKPPGVSSFVAGLYTSPEEFERQIAYMTKKNYKTVSSKEFYEILQSGKNPEQKTVMLTFDDSTISHYTNAYRILKKYNQVGTFFVTSHRSQISNAQLKEMSDNGMDIQSHTQTHPDLVKLTDLNRIQSEIGGSKIELEARTGKEVIAIAYPGCVADGKAYNALSNNGYLLGFSCGKSIDHRLSSKYSIARVHNPYNVDDFKKILSGIYPF